MISLSGTETDFFAGYRACPCLKDHYRTHLLEGCHECGKNGLVCQGEYVSLKPGYWWQWRNHSYKSRYQEFIENLIAAIPALDENSVKYPYPLPTPYMCQVPDSCAGGMVTHHARMVTRDQFAPYAAWITTSNPTLAKKSPSKSWIAGQLSLVAVILLETFSLLAWKRKRKLATERDLDLMDRFLSKLKILIGFYQVTHGLLNVFSYIRWPDSLDIVARY